MREVFMYADSQPTSPVPQDTILSLLTEIEGVSGNISRSIGSVADALTGIGPENGSKQATVPTSAIERLRSILYTLSAAQGDSNRAKRALGMSDLSDPKPYR